MTVDGSPNVSSKDSPLIRGVKDIGFGSAAGMVSKVFEHPFDLTKVRLQSQVLDKKARFNGPIDCLTKTWQNEGVRGLYRGLPAPIVGAMVENASLFLTYREFQNLIQYVNHRPASEKPSLPELALAAAGAGAVTSFFLTPIELVKCKMQVQMLVNPPTHITKPHTLPGPISVLLSVIRTTGFRGLWLGHTGTFIRESGGTAAWFTTKEFVASLLVARRTPEGGPPPPPNQRVQLKAWESALSGAIAGAAFNFALFPADTVKSAMQTEAELRPTRLSPTPTAPGAKPPPPPPPPSFFRTFGAMYKAQGIRGLYAGCGITVARAIPSSGMIFLIYDGLSKRFG